MNWLEPWDAIPESHKIAFEKQLQKEMHYNHPLMGVKVEAIGKNYGKDDVLFRLTDNAYEWAVVHLTYSQNTSRRYPLTEFYKDWDDFVENRMKEDNFGFDE